MGKYKNKLEVAITVQHNISKYKTMKRERKNEKNQHMKIKQVCSGYS
jgi:hypothetical protein